MEWRHAAGVVTLAVGLTVGGQAVLAFPDAGYATKVAESAVLVTTAFVVLRIGRQTVVPAVRRLDVTIARFRDD